MKPTVFVKWAVVVVTTVLFGVVLGFFTRVVGTSLNVLCIAAPLIATLFFGFRIGLAVLAVNWTVSFVVLSKVTGLSPLEGVVRAIVPFVASVFLTYGAGRIYLLWHQRKQADNTVRESEQRYRLVFEQSVDAILLLDEVGNVVDVNPPIRDHVGFCPEELIGNPLMDSGMFCHPSFQLRFDDLVSEAPGGVQEHELVGCNKVGDRIFLQLTLSPLKASFENIAWICLLRNITQKREDLEMNHETKKMEAVGRLAGGIAFDLNNILNAIVGSAHAFRHEHPDCDAGTEDFDNIAAACQRGANLACQLFGLARKSHLHMEMFSLNSVLVGVLSKLELEKQASIQFEMRLEPNLPGLEGDKAQIETALSNLCSNALDAMSKGGLLTVTTYSDADGVWMHVEDTGTGMDIQTRQRAFEPFFTTKAIGEGTGLGLSTAYGIMQNHDGKILLHSLPNEGTEVTLWFPRHKVNLKVQKFEDEAFENVDVAVLANRTVLLVDDEFIVLRAGMRMLKTLGCKVITAQSGTEAISLLKVHPEISLVLLDLIMPVMDGAKTLQKLREVNERVPVIVVSGYTQNVERLALFKQAKNCEFLPKPYNSEALIATVRKLFQP